jgi:hypothetical protein
MMKEQGNELAQYGQSGNADLNLMVLGRSGKNIGTDDDKNQGCEVSCQTIGKKPLCFL